MSFAPSLFLLFFKGLFTTFIKDPWETEVNVGRSRVSYKSMKRYFPRAGADLSAAELPANLRNLAKPAGVGEAGCRRSGC